MVIHIFKEKLVRKVEVFAYCKEFLLAQYFKLLDEHKYEESCRCEIKLESREKL